MTELLIIGISAVAGAALGFGFGRAWQTVIHDHERISFQEDLSLALMKKYIDGEGNDA